MHPDTHRSLVLDESSIELRRQLGPTAWMVLEELLFVSTGPADACQAEVSIRALATRLGLAKDTIARALTRLRHVGLVTASQSRATTGAFETGSYRLYVPDAITLTDRTTFPTTIASPASSRPRAPRASRSTVQLSLAIES